MDGRIDIVGVVTVPIASPDGGSGVALVLVPRSGVVCCSTGMGIYCSPFWGGDFRVMFGAGVRITRGGALNRRRRRGGAER